jgi:hypothetical protein
MSARNWDRLRKQKQCEKNGTEGLAEERPPDMSAYKIYESTLPGCSTDSSRSSMKNSGSKPKTVIVRTSPLILAFRRIGQAVSLRGEFNALNDVELREAREVCQSAIQRVNALLLERTRTRPSLFRSGR